MVIASDEKGNISHAEAERVTTNLATLSTSLVNAPRVQSPTKPSIMEIMHEEPCCITSTPQS
jgi:hypothetical protein